MGMYEEMSIIWRNRCMNVKVYMIFEKKSYVKSFQLKEVSSLIKDLELIIFVYVMGYVIRML